MLEKKTEELIEVTKELWNTSMSSIMGDTIMAGNMDEKSMKLMLLMNKCTSTAFELCLEQAKTNDQMIQKLDELLSR
ncbi:MAG: hypothetical protein LUI14_14465 [Lachnospiraceae bacterium]|nr:hypothetical protein [Lachnospiraceae bacterium]